MTRYLPLLLALLACGPSPDPSRYGTARVRIDCPSPTATWARAAVPGLDALGGPAWVVAEPADVTVRCAELRAGVAGQYEIGTAVVLLDPVQVFGETGTRLVSQHELTHWRIAQGPHPDRALLHLCRLVGEVPGGCWSGRYGRALMNPSLGGTGSGPGFDEAWAGDLPGADVTWMDGEFLRAMLAP